MARRVIGLDVGTNAVSIAQVEPGAPPVLRAFGQVALARDAMREGEVVDEVAVAAAIERLRSEVGLKRAKVRVGVASPRVIVRQVEMPTMTEAELRSALQFQAQDLIPIPIDEAVLDFSVLETVTDDDGDSTTRVLLAAAHRAMVERLVRAVEAGGFGVEAVDLVPLALIRSLALSERPPPGDAEAPGGQAEPPGAEGIVSFGAGVSVVTVHEGGLPAFVRILGTAGRALTDAIATDLDIPVDTAESLKRHLDTEPGTDDLVDRARRAIERPLTALLDEVRSSLDYYRNQPGASRLVRVVVTGGSTPIPGLVDRLAALVGVPVEVARPRARLAVADIGFAEDDLPRLDPYLATPVGLALAPIVGGPVIDLLSRPSRAAGSRRRTVAAAVVAAIALVAVLGYLTWQRQQEIDDVESDLASVQATNSELESEIASLSDAQAKAQQVEASRAQIQTLLAGDVSWSRMLQEIARTIPDDVWLDSFQGSLDQAQATPPAVPSESAEPLIPGSVAVSATGLDFPAVASWITRMTDDMPSFAQVWVPNASTGTFEGRDVVTFTSSASLTEAARSGRAEEIAGGGS